MGSSRGRGGGRDEAVAARRREDSGGDYNARRHGPGSGVVQGEGDSSSPVVGFVDGQWVSGGILGDDADSDASKDADPGGKQGNADDGQRESGHGSSTLGKPAVAGTAATATATVPGTSGGLPRRPRWDKAAPTATAGLSAAVAKASGRAVAGGKKLVWGAAGGGGGTAKRPLWGGTTEAGVAAPTGGGNGSGRGPGQAQVGCRVFRGPCFLW